MSRASTTSSRASEARGRRVRADRRSMRRLIRLSCALGLGFVLAACSWQQAIVQHQEQEGRMTRSLEAYVGRSVADVAQDRGPPTSTIDLGPNKLGFHGQITTETPEV